MIAAGVIGGVFLVCTLVMFLGVKERDGETRLLQIGAPGLKGLTESRQCKLSFFFFF